MCLRAGGQQGADQGKSRGPTFSWRLVFLAGAQGTHVWRGKDTITAEPCGGEGGGGWGAGEAGRATEKAGQDCSCQRQGNRPARQADLVLHECT